MIGLRADAVDYEKWPELTPEKLEGAFEAVASQLTGEGFDATWCLTDTGETAEHVVEEGIRELSPDVVLIGAGVRTDPDHFLLFEKVINLVHAKAPEAKIAFNTLPFDSVDAVKRWI